MKLATQNMVGPAERALAGNEPRSVVFYDGEG